MKNLIIGIAGGTGSGKSTLTENIKQRFGDNISVLLHDYYYKAHDELSYEERTQLNYDIPSAYDTDLLVRDLELLKRGQTAFAPVYDFAVYNRRPETQEIRPAKVIVVEGILVLEDKQLCDLFDVKVFVDADDMQQRGRSFDSIVTQYLTTVKPLHELYVEPSKKNADVVILHGGENTVALDLLYQKIANFIGGVEA